MATGIRCSRCEVLNRTDVQACRACGEPLPTLRPVAAERAGPAPAPNSPPRILRPTQPAPLKPPSLAHLPSSGRAPAPPAPASQKPPGAAGSPPRLVPQPPAAPAAVSLPPVAQKPLAVAPQPGSPSEGGETLPPARVGVRPPPPQSPPSPTPRSKTPPEGGPSLSVVPPPASSSSSSSSTPPVARRTPTARGPAPPPQRPGTSARPAQAVVPRPPPPTASAPQAQMGARPRVVVAPVLRTLPAMLVDGALVGGLAFAASALLVPALLPDAPPRPSGIFGLLELVLMSPLVVVMFAALVLALSVALHVIVVPTTGATVGGLLAGVRVVVRSSGQAPGIGRAALRGLTSALGALLLLAGPLWALWLDPLRRGLGDVVSGTLPVTKGSVP